MVKVKINKDKCKGCLLCVEFCNQKLLQESKDLNKRGINYVVFVDKENKCKGCNFCAIVCPEACIEIEK